MVVHRPNHTMIDINSLTRRYGQLIAMHCMVSSILHCQDVQHKPLAYDRDTFLDSKTEKLTPSDCEQIPIPILFNGFITQICTNYFKEQNVTVSPKSLQLSHLARSFILVLVNFCQPIFHLWMTL